MLLAWSQEYSAWQMLLLRWRNQRIWSDTKKGRLALRSWGARRGGGTDWARTDDSIQGEAEMCVGECNDTGQQRSPEKLQGRGEPGIQQANWSMKGRTIPKFGKEYTTRRAKAANSSATAPLSIR